MTELERRKSDLVAEAESALDEVDLERFDLIEEQLVNVNSLIRHAAAADEQPKNDIWAAVIASSR